MPDRLFDVVVIGGGPSGMLSALALANLNLKICLVERQDIKKRKIIRDGRAIAISSKSREILTSFNLWQKLSEHSGQIDQIRVTDQHSPLFLHFDNKLVGNKPLGYMIENSDIVTTLTQEIINNKNIDVISPHNYIAIENTKANVQIILEDKSILSAKLLIAAEGKFSNLREKFKLKTHKWSYNQSAIVCNIRHEYSHDNIAQEMFMPSGPFAILPLKDPFCSSIVWTEETNAAKTLMSMEDKNFNYFLEKKFTDYLGEIEVISEKVSYPLSVVLSNEYYRERVAFVGEVIHSMHPLAGQGLNQTIRDIHSLIKLIQSQKEIGLDIGSQIMLQKYQSERKLDNLSMIAITDILNKIFSNNRFPINIARKIGLSSINKLPFMQRFLMNYAMGDK